MLARARRSVTPPPANIPARILAAASQLLATAGISALTQPQVSRAAGVSQSHLTYYFPRRADLMLAIARHALEATVGEMRASVREQRGARVGRAAEAMQARISDPRVVRLMIGLIVASEDDRSIKKSLAEFIDSVRAMLGGVLGEMRLAADAETAATIHALAVGLAVLNLARDTDASRIEVGALLKTALPRIAAIGAAPNTAKTAATDHAAAPRSRRTKRAS